MSETASTKRIVKVASEMGVGVDHIIDFLNKNGHTDINRNSKVNEEQYLQLAREFQAEKSVKEESKLVGISSKTKKEAVVLENTEVKKPAKVEEEKEDILIKDANSVAPAEEVVRAKPEKEIKVKVISKIDLEAPKAKTTKAKTTKTTKSKEKAKEEEIVEKPVDIVKEVPPVVEEKKEVEVVPPPPVKEEKKEDFMETKFTKLGGPTIVGKIVLPVVKEKEDKKKPVASSSADGIDLDKKKKRRRIQKEGGGQGFQPTQGGGGGKPFTPRFDNKNKFAGKPREERVAPTEDQIQQQIKETLARLSGSGKSKAAKYRKEKREEIKEKLQQEAAQQEVDKKTLQVAEFISASQLATMMNIQVNEIIKTCMSIGLFISINQRLDAETISMLAEEFGYKVEFVTVEAQESIAIEADKPEDLMPRSPIVTVMGHVDHGKTSLLDFVRKANVIAGEAGGITQHIGAYSVQLEDGRKITFLDTPGHEAFTAMRARGAKVTDVAIIVVAADDSVMPQTKEAINHAQAAGVPMVFAINKIDKPGANPEKIKEALSIMNILVEDWGGKYQCQEISAKKGLNIEALLDKVLLEAEMLDLKANPNRNASGTVIESSLDKGRGYVSTILVQNGTLRIGDVVLAGPHSGRVKAMYNERQQAIKEAGPATPVLILGLSGAPQAGDNFNVMSDEREARDIANKRLQLMREQGIKTQKHITLDEIGRRLAIGDFKELNVIVKGDVDGSVEALSGSLLKLSTPKIQINVIHKSVGQISESDVLLASASNAIIIGFQVRPSSSARKLAEAEQIDIRLYSIIYDAINQIKDAMEGMLAPEFEEKIVCNIEVREVFNITKVGTIAGCMVLDGKVTRNTKVRVIRDGIVLHSGSLGSLKRFKDDVKDVVAGFECGLNIDKFDDVKVGDIIEGYDQVEVKPKL
ncbi:MAG: translation initiation factor IF-2 [Bacteroidetes bacterium]|nr:translation initiation factor IF-2 [Bacteroidota bacterium]